MFSGEHIAKLDSKGRIVFPAQLKRQMSEIELGNGFVVQRNKYAKSLTLHTKVNWDLINKDLLKKLNPAISAKHDEFIRLFNLGVEPIFFDGSFRIIIPKHFLKLIDASTEIALLGQANRIEIWSKEEYKKLNTTNNVDFENLTKELFGENPIFND